MPQVVLAAVQQNGCALLYASPVLRRDKEVVLQAVRQPGALDTLEAPGVAENRKAIERGK